MKIAVIFMNFGPYHIARVNALAQRRERGQEVIGIEVAPASTTYAWQRLGIEAVFPLVSLCPQARAAEEVSGMRQVQAVWRCLREYAPDALAICGYRNPVMLAALAWAKLNGRTAVLMTETKKDDFPRKRFAEWIKSLIIRQFDAALVGGVRQSEYLQELGMHSSHIHTGYDVVDNQFFQMRADQARAHDARWRKTLGLPDRFFLSVSRFVPKKNLHSLLEAYKIYRQQSGPHHWGLVLVGSGPLESELHRLVIGLDGVHLPGFKQVDELSLYYGLAGCFIMPSSHGEQWGLVVNEAMASGLPVLVSQACGCAPNLVHDGFNGFTFDPFDKEGLARLMVKMSSGEVDLKAMGQASREIIANFTPEIFAINLMRAIETGKAARRRY